MPIATAHKIAAAIAFVLLSAWILVGSWQSPPHTRQTAQQQSTEKPKGNPQHYEPWLTKDAAGFFTFLLVLVGSAQVALFYVQLRLIRKSLGPAETAAKSAAVTAQAVIDNERPWVGPVTVNCDQIVAGWPSQGTIVIRNTGRRPALRMRVGHRAVILDQGQVPTAPTVWEVPKALFPNTDDFYQPTVEGGRLSEADVAAIAAGTRVLWIIARIEYFDRDGDRHHTNISTRWGGMNRSVMVPEGDNDAN